jgi:hypothetical protein
MIPLSETGKQQADVVAQSFDRSPDLIVTSPFLRARHTAVPTTERFPSVPVTHWPVEEFTYLGRLHGRRTTGLERRPLVDAATADDMRRFNGFRTTYLIPNCPIITLSLRPERGWRALGATVGHLPDALRTGE